MHRAQIFKAGMLGEATPRASGMLAGGSSTNALAFFFQTAGVERARRTNRSCEDILYLGVVHLREAGFCECGCVLPTQSGSSQTHVSFPTSYC